MNSNFFEANHIDADQYPLDVEYIPDSQGGYLIEGGDPLKEYRRPSPSFGSIDFDILPPIIYKGYLSEYDSAVEFSASAVFDQSRRHSTLKLFGTDRDLESISVLIHEAKMYNIKQIKFEAGHAYIWDDPVITDSEEWLSIQLALPVNQFKLFLRAWECNHLGAVRVELAKAYLNGLYVLDPFAPWFEYKILPDKKIVKNWQDMPEHFTDCTHQSWNTKEDGFSIKWRKSKFGQKSIEPIEEIKEYETEISSLEALVQHSKVMVEYSEKLSKMAGSFKNQLWWMLLILIGVLLYG